MVCCNMRYRLTAGCLDNLLVAPAFKGSAAAFFPFPQRPSASEGSPPSRQAAALLAVGHCCQPWIPFNSNCAASVAHAPRKTPDATNDCCCPMLSQAGHPYACCCQLFQQVPTCLCPTTTLLQKHLGAGEHQVAAPRLTLVAALGVQRVCVSHATPVPVGAGAVGGSRHLYASCSERLHDLSSPSVVPLPLLPIPVHLWHAGCSCSLR